MSNDSLRREIIEVLIEAQEQFDQDHVRLSGLLYRRMADALIDKGLIVPEKTEPGSTEAAPGTTPGLNGFGGAILRIEAERMVEARRAIDAGWTPEDHPDGCCPDPEPELKPANVPEPEYAATRRRSAEAKVVRLKERLTRLEQLKDPGRRADAGEINIPFHRREKATDTAITRGVQESELRARLAHTESRVRYWAGRESSSRA